MPDGLLSDADLGLSFGPTTAARSLDIRPAAPAPIPGSQPTGPADALPAPTPSAAAPSALLSDADLGLAPHPAATAQPDAPNPSGPLANSADDGYLSGAAKGLGTAAVKAYGNTVGFVGGLSGFEDYLMARAEAKIRGVPVEQAQADMAARRAKTEAGMAQSPLGRLALASDPTKTMPTPDSAAAPILARTGEYRPTSEPGKVAMAGAETALSALGPGVGAARGGIGALAAGAVRAAPVNAVIGAVSQGATDVTGDPLLGAAAGMAAVPLAEAGVSRLGQVAAPIIAGTPLLRNLPAVKAGVEARAGAGLLASASDPAALRRFAADPAPAPIVPGSPQTLAAAVGNDPGLFAAEKAARTTSPETFNANDAERQKAQAGAIDAVQREGDVFAPGALIRGRLDALDQAADRVEQHLNDRYSAVTADRAQAQQSDAVTAQADLAGRMLDRQGIAAADKVQADAARQAPLDALAADHAAQEASLGQGARDAVGALGPVAAPEQAGAALRGAVEDVRGQVRKARSDLYKAVDPDGSLALVSSPVRAAADGILKGVDPYAAPLTADAQRLIGKARALPDVMPFSSLTAFEQDITQAMSAERRSAGETFSLKLLGDLKGSVQSAIYDAADNQHAHEARLRDAGVAPDGPGLQERLGHDWVYGDEPPAAGPAAYSNDDIYPPGRAPEPANDALRPNFDAAAAGRSSTAKAAHADYAQTYRNGPVGAALKTNGFAGQYRMPDAGVMQAAWRRGPGGYEATKAFLDAAKGDPRAVQAIADHSLNELRVKGGPLGVLRQADVDRWAAAHDGSIRALEEALPGYRGVVTDAARATDALMQAGVANKAVREAAEDAAASDALQADKARASDLKGANEADRSNTAAALRDRAAADRTADQADKAERDAGVAQVRGIRREARATPAGQFVEGATPVVASEVENRVGSMLSTGTSGAARMRGIVQSVADNPDALAGLRRAGVNYLSRAFQTDSGAISGSKLIRFVRQNRDVLNELYGPAGVNTFAAVARDAENMVAYDHAMKVRGSDTASNVFRKVQEHGAGAAVHGSLMFVAADALKDALFEGHFDPKLAGTAGLVFLANTLRQAGIRRVADLQRDAMLDPELARVLISKAPTAEHPEKLHVLAGLVRRGLIVGPEMQRQRQQ